jgi:hypothetical protein
MARRVGVDDLFLLACSTENLAVQLRSLERLATACLQARQREVDGPLSVVERERLLVSLHCGVELRLLFEDLAEACLGLRIAPERGGFLGVFHRVAVAPELEAELGDLGVEGACPRLVEGCCFFERAHEIARAPLAAKKLPE